MRQPGDDYRLNPHDVFKMQGIEHNSPEYL